jgi:hypothetical protein
VRVLQLLGEHPLDRVRRAVEACQLDQAISAEAIIERARGLAAIESRTGAASLATPGTGGTPPVHVPRPDLSRFNQLLSGPVSQGEAPEEALTIRADAIPPEDQGHVVFA